MCIILLVLTFGRSHREKKRVTFSFSSLFRKIGTFFLCLDHINYSRWIPAHIRNMKSLPEKAKPDFAKNWTVTKSRNSFSSLPIDQAHEQNNTIIKGSGEATGLTEHSNALEKWLWPNFVRMTEEFETQIDSAEIDNEIVESLWTSIIAVDMVPTMSK